MASVFSKIAAGEIPCYKVHEDKDYLAFLDINPIAVGHTLVIPKRETDYIFDLPDEELAGLTIFAKRVAASLKANLECKRVAVVVLGLEVPHAHIHLIPINSEADVDFSRKLKPAPEEFENVLRRIRF